MSDTTDAVALHPPYRADELPPGGRRLFVCQNMAAADVLIDLGMCATTVFEDTKPASTDWAMVNSFDELFVTISGDGAGYEFAVNAKRALDAQHCKARVELLTPSGADDGAALVAALRGRNGEPAEATRERINGWCDAIVAGDSVGDSIMAPTDAKSTQAAELVQLADVVDLFHHDDSAYAGVPVGSHRETYPVKSRAFRLWLVRKFHERHDRPPHAQALQDALGVLAAQALFNRPEVRVFVRMAECGDTYWLDLGDADWRAVRIDADGWRVIENPPVRFIRPRGMRPLPVPVAGGSVADLRPFVNVGSDDDWALLVAWLAAAMRPVGPYPALALQGEQGSAKSTTARGLRALVDPNAAPLRAEPREARDLMIAATNGWLLAFDNLSHLTPWLSDGLCRLATGGGFATRQLYTDDDEKLFDAMRPVMVNGIVELATRGDLLDRAILLTLPTIPEDRRRTEADLWQDFEAARPGILGALLDAVSAGMRNLPTTTLDRLPRMADFARWVVAAEPALGLTPGAFLRAYSENRATANENALEAAAVGGPLLAMMAGHPLWTGTASELLAALEADSFTDERTRKRRDWPRTPRGLGSALRRIAPNLRAMGTAVTFERRPGGRRTRTIRLEKVAAQPSQQSPPSRNLADGPETGDSAGTVGTVADSNRPAQSGDSDSAEAVRDGRDDRDGSDPTLSTREGWSTL